MVRKNLFWGRLSFLLGAVWMAIVPGTGDQAFGQYGTHIPKRTPPAATTPNQSPKRGDAAFNDGLSFQQLEEKCAELRERLDRQRPGIKAHYRRLNELSSHIESSARPPSNLDAVAKAVESQIAREEQRIQDWGATERQEINLEREALAAEERSIGSLRSEVANVIGWLDKYPRCDSGLTLEQCELPQNQNAKRDIHSDWRAKTRSNRARRDWLVAEIDSRTRSAAQRRAAVVERNSKLPGSLETRRRSLEAQHRKFDEDIESELQRVNEQTARENDAQRYWKAYLDRVKQFNEDERGLADLERQLARLRESRPVAIQPPRANSRHWVVFFAHDQMRIGHTFVAWIHEDENQQATVMRAVGFYPGAGALPDPLPTNLDVFTWMIAGGPVPGEILDEFKRWNPASTAYLTIPVSRDVFDRTQAIMREWQNKPYRLHTKPQNCIDWV